MLWSGRGVVCVACALRDNVIERYLNANTRTWRIDDAALSEVDNDLQAIVNCSEEGDLILLDVTDNIQPSRRIVIPWQLTWSARMRDTTLQDGVFPESRRKTTFNCPNEDEGVFFIQ